MTPQPRQQVTSLRAWLFRPVDIASLVYFRVAFGLLLFILIAGRLLFLFERDWIRQYYLDPPILFKYYGFSWVQPFPGMWMYAHFMVMAIAALFVGLGLFYRLSAIVFFLTWTYYFLLERAFYLNHFYLVCLFAFLLIFMPAHRSFSIDSWRRPTIRSDFAPAWCADSIRLQMGLVYFFAGIAKLYPDWLRGDVVRPGIGNFAKIPLIGPYLVNEASVYFFSYGGLLFDLFVFPALMYRRTRPWAIAAAAFFHGFNVIAFNIDVFPWLAFATTLMFLPYDWPRRAAARLGVYRPRQLAAMPPSSLRYKQIATLLLVTYFVIQLALPLRQFAYAGDPKWHEYGQRWAWRMMAGGKTGHAEFIVTDPATGHTWRIDPNDYLHPRQVRKLVGDPDCMIQFSHFLAEEYRKKGHDNVEVRARSWVSFNGRPEQIMIDPAIDLASQPRGIRVPPWVRPVQD